MEYLILFALIAAFCIVMALVRQRSPFQDW
jgi:hypothetical protein